MKKKMILWMVIVLALALLAGCGRTAAPTQESAAEPTQEEPSAGLPNPVKASSPEEIAQRFGVEMKAPEGAGEVSYAIIEGDLPLAQMGFALDGIMYNYRTAKAEAYTDISGMYYEWQEVSAEEGAEGSIRLIPDGAGVYDRFDAESGLVYSLSMDRGASADKLEATARLLWGDASEELASLLDTLHARYFPGTAGSSLSAAACAAEMADFFAESGLSPDEADRITQSYYASLTPEDAQLFEMQLNGAVSAFSELCGENGAGLLSDCGYAAAHFPWDEGVRDCFVALLGTD